MKNRDFAFAATVIVIAALVVGFLAYRYENPPLSQNPPTGTFPTLSGSLQITNASLTSGGYLTIQVKNTGQSNLIGLSFSLSPAPESYGFGGGFHPNPAPTYPIYPSEYVSGAWSLTLSSEYRPGLQVTVFVVGTFSDGSQASASFSLVVSQ